MLNKHRNNFYGCLKLESKSETNEEMEQIKYNRERGNLAEIQQC